MATRALERGTVERRLVASARVLIEDASGVAVDDDVLDYVVFVGSVEEILEDLTALTGRDR